jgi:hypothetical protein
MWKAVILNKHTVWHAKVNFAVTERHLQLQNLNIRDALFGIEL